MSILFGNNAFASENANIYHRTLKNGLEVYVKKIDPGEAKGWIWHVMGYKVGSAHDPLGKSGLAHYLEHLMFRGSQQFKSFYELIKDPDFPLLCGAETHYHFTFYYDLIPIENLTFMMTLEADRMQSLRITREKVNAELKDILDERMRRIESSYVFLFQKMMDKLYPNLYYARPPVGFSEKEIRSITSKDLLEFYEKYYNPERATLLIIGAVDPHHIFNLAEQYYGNLVSLKKENSYFQPIFSKALLYRAPGSNRLNTYRAIKDKKSESTLIFLYKAPGRMVSKRGRNIYGLLAEALKNPDSPLYHECVVKQKLAKKISVSYNSQLFESSWFLIRLELLENINPKQAADKLDIIVSELLEKGLSESCLQSAKKVVINLGAFFTRNKTNKSSVFFYIYELNAGVPAQEIDPTFQWVKEIDLTSMNTALKTIFSGHKVTGWIILDKEKSTFVVY